MDYVFRRERTTLLSQRGGVLRSESKTERRRAAEIESRSETETENRDGTQSKISAD